jgi:Family of unknown function (DUF6600)/FecR protein
MKSTLLALLLAGLTCAPAAAPAADTAYSHARIVRLSFVEGQVTVQRGGSTKWSNAPVNTPIQEGFKLQTDMGSFAEIEFEDGSTARLGELSSVEFTQLALAASGDKLSGLTLDSGYGSFHLVSPNGNQFEVKAGDATLTPHGQAQFRADLTPPRLRVEVFKGSVDVSSPEGTALLSKDNVLEVSTGTEEAFNLSTGISKDDWDHWVEQRDKLQAANHIPKAYRGVNAPTYGWSDLYSYGNWSYCGGYGLGWSPFASAGWSPYTFGQWAWYPGYGYTWIGYEPWGWLPYHYGGWSFDASCGGWQWFPGGFANWSPGLVSWYAGPGWIGWQPTGPAPATGGGTTARPRPPRSPAPRLAGCAAGQRCVAAETLDAFAQGKTVRPTTMLSGDVSQATAVAEPEVAPEASAFLPGRPSKPALAAGAEIRPNRALDFSFPAASAAAPHTARRPAPTSTLGGGGFGSTHFESRGSIESGGSWSGGSSGRFGGRSSSGSASSTSRSAPRASSPARVSGGDFGGSARAGGSSGGAAHSSPTPHH